MTARRYPPQPLNSPRLQERKEAADRVRANARCFYPSPCQEPEKGPASAAGVHAHVVGAVAGTGAADESSDSEAEQEGPQKLIRKVSTSGQIRSKVRHIAHTAASFDDTCILGQKRKRKGCCENLS